MLPLGQCALGAAGTVNHQLLRASIPRQRFGDSHRHVDVPEFVLRILTWFPVTQQTLASIQAVDTPGLHQVAAGQTHMNLSLIMGVKRPRNPVFFVRSVSHRHMCFPATRCLLMM